MNLQDTINQALITELGIEGLPPQAQQEAIATVGRSVLQALIVDLLEKMPQSKRSEFQKAIEVGDQKLIESLINENIPDPTVFIGQSVEKELAGFKALRS